MPQHVLPVIKEAVPRAHSRAAQPPRSTTLMTHVVACDETPWPTPLRVRCTLFISRTAGCGSDLYSPPGGPVSPEGSVPLGPHKAAQVGQGSGNREPQSSCSRALSKQGIFLSFTGLSRPEDLPRPLPSPFSFLSFTGWPPRSLSPLFGGESPFHRSIGGPGDRSAQRNLPQISLRSARIWRGERCFERDRRKALAGLPEARRTASLSRPEIRLGRGWKRAIKIPAARPQGVCRKEIDQDQNGRRFGLHRGPCRGLTAGQVQAEVHQAQAVGEPSTVKPLRILYGGAGRRPEGASSMGLCLALPAHNAGPLPDSDAFTMPAFRTRRDVRF